MMEYVGYDVLKLNRESFANLNTKGLYQGQYRRLTKEEIIKAKEEIMNSRKELDQEIKERRSEVGLQEKRMIQKEENLERRAESFVG